MSRESGRNGTKKGITGSVTVSLCMIVRNEERWLGRCLDSIDGIVDEIVIVDTGSTDRTVEIAARHRGQVLHHAWQDDFSLARNSALARAGSDWILHLDADEELSPESRRQLRDVLARADADGLQLRVRNVLPAGEMQQHEEIKITRLFRNRPAYRYEQPIHEQIRPSIERHGGRIAETDLIIVHHGYAEKTAQGGEPRAARNLRMLEKAIAGSPNDAYLHFQLGVTQKSLGQNAAAYASFRRALGLGCEGLSNESVERLYMKLAQIALAADRLGEATEYAQASLERNPRNVVSLHVLALSHMFMGNLRDAYPLFERLRGSSELNATSRRDVETVIAYCREQVGSEGRR